MVLIKKLRSTYIRLLIREYFASERILSSHLEISAAEKLWTPRISTRNMVNIWVSVE